MRQLPPATTDMMTAIGMGVIAALFLIAAWSMAINGDHGRAAALLVVALGICFTALWICKENLQR